MSINPNIGLLQVVIWINSNGCYYFIKLIDMFAFICNDKFIFSSR